MKWFKREPVQPVHRKTLEDMEFKATALWVPPHPDEMLSKQAKVPAWPFLMVIAFVVIGGALWMVPPSGGLADLHNRVEVHQTKLGSPEALKNIATDTLLGMARGRITVGDTTSAINALLQLTEREPNNVEFLSLLASTYETAQRKQEAINTLERIQRIAPSLPHQRTLVRLYAAMGDETKSLNAMTTLVNAFGQAEANDHLILASKWLAANEPRRALAALETLQTKHPQAVDVDITALHIKSLLTLARAEANAGVDAAKPLAEAVARAQAWLKANPSKLEGEVAAIAQPFVQAGLHEPLVGLLQPLISAQAPRTTGLWIEAMARLNRTDAAMQRLDVLAANDRSPEMLRLRMKLAIDGGRLTQAMQMARQHGLSLVPGPTLAMLGEAALDTTSRAPSGKPELDARLDTRRASEREAVLKELWAPDVRARLSKQDSLLATRVALAVGDNASAMRLADEATRSCDGKTTCAVRLARIHTLLGHPTEALAALKLAEEGGDIDDALLGDYARTAIVLNQSREGLARLERQRRAIATPAFNEAWMLLATANGRHADVTRTLEATRDEALPDALTRELFKMALDAKAHALAATLSTRLDPGTIKLPDRVLLAHAYMDLGRTAESLTLWRQIRQESSAYNDAFTHALETAVTRGLSVPNGQPGLQNELAQLYLARLQSTPAGPARDAMMDKLLDMGEPERAIAALELMARSNPKRWLNTFEATSAKIGQVQRRVVVWRAIVEDEKIPADMRTTVALRLLEAGERSVAETALRELTRQSAPEDAAVVQMMASWGTRFTPDQMDWLEARARTVGGDRKMGASEIDRQRSVWLRRLTEGGGATRTVQIVRSLQPQPTTGPVHEALLAAQTALSQRSATASTTPPTNTR